jgi:ATP/maltotriose-dependent transcriptional regulator MalT
VLDTDAQVALAQGRLADATATARRAIEMARATGNRGVELTAMLTEARALRADGDLATAESRYDGAATLARAGHSAGRTREVLREWAELRAERADHRGAYELTTEALSVK